MASSKKSMSAHQLHRMIGTSYEAAWFLFHRLRDAATDIDPDTLGGPDRFVEADETYIGGKAKNKAFRSPPPKMAVFTLVERDGKARSFHIANVTAESDSPLIKAAAHPGSHLRTYESSINLKVGQIFA